MRGGDVYVLNDPYHGGTHLPDVTVVTPVYLDDGDAGPSFFVASRGHHADIGGITPGSMPPFSASIAEEGVLIDNFKLIERGTLREGALRDLLSGGHSSVAQSHPESRRPARANRSEREGRPGIEIDCCAIRLAARCRPTCATFRTMPRSRCVG